MKKLKRKRKTKEEMRLEAADRLVEDALLKLALGYTVKVKKYHKLKKSGYDEREKKVEEETLQEVWEEQSVPPSLTAQTFWLKNRCPELWNEKSEKGEVDKQTGGIIEIPIAKIKGQDKDE